MHWLRLTNLIVLIHVLVGGTLVLFILLHAGRGGGLSDMFGGGMGGGLSGSSAVERNLDRFTVVLGCIFGITTVLLALRLKQPGATLGCALVPAMLTTPPAGTQRPPLPCSEYSGSSRIRFSFVFVVQRPGLFNGPVCANARFVHGPSREGG